jgi:hypothetical protein
VEEVFGAVEHCGFSVVPQRFLLWPSFCLSFKFTEAAAPTIEGWELFPAAASAKEPQAEQIRL